MKFRDIRNDRRGGIEGLPLQLMIIILIATMGTAIIVGWMGSIETPKSIGEVTVGESEIVSSGGTVASLTIVVRDQDGQYLEGATVVLDGLNVRAVAEDGSHVTAYCITDAEGKASFIDLRIDPSGNSRIGFLTVVVSMAGYGENSSTRVPVIL